MTFVPAESEGSFGEEVGALLGGAIVGAVKEGQLATSQYRSLMSKVARPFAFASGGGSPLVALLLPLALSACSPYDTFEGELFAGAVNPVLNTDGSGQIYGFHPGGANVVYADGSVHTIPQNIAPAVLAWEPASLPTQVHVAN